VDGGLCSDYNPLRNVYWGDLHDHSFYSIDSYGFGNRRTPLDAYQYAMGTCTNVLGVPAQIDRPLDFVVVSDHSEYIGVTDQCFDLDGKSWPDGTSSYCQTLQNLETQSYPASDLLPYATVGTCPEADAGCIAAKEPAIESSDPAGYAEAQQSVWQQEVQTVDQVYAGAQCKFTPLPAFEWTATPNGNTLHHIVVFANDNVPAQPLDYLHYDSEPALLSGLQSQCTGSCDVITIQHNSNLSGGFAWTTSSTALNQTLRAKYERLVELHQNKGNSECLYDPADGYNDPLCDFEFRLGNKEQTKLEVAPGYVREGLKLGITDWSVDGVNDYQFGFVGATDNHQATPGNVRESTWNGSIAAVDNTADSRLVDDQRSNGVTNPGGITGVWAEQNLQPNVFAALKRREAFVTSGPRIAVRFYQTWDQTTNFCADPNFPEELESDVRADAGVVMGGTMPLPMDGGPAPRFVVFALADTEIDPTDGGPVPLAEMQIVKGSYDPTSATTVTTIQSELVRDPPVTYETGSSFCHIFADTSWNPAQPSFYYPKILQAPTWRWSHYDCMTVGNAMTDAGVPVCNQATQNVMIQERAWGSPIWYLP
jgi:hypothetical protein